MCRSIRTLANFEPPATDEEIAAAALQYVRKVSGSTKPTRANEELFAEAVTSITLITRELIDRLASTGPKRDREIEAAKAKARAAKRYGT